MKQDFTTRIAAIFCAFLMIVPDVARASQAPKAFNKIAAAHTQQTHEAYYNALSDAVLPDGIPKQTKTAKQVAQSNCRVSKP